MAKPVRLYSNWEQVVSDASNPEVKRKAELVLGWANRTAPVDTGEYKSKLTMIKLANGGYRILALADHSIYVEFGTWKMAPYHTLATALQAAKG